MLAYNSSQDLKKLILDEVVKHRKADQIVQGSYGTAGEDFKGCAVGCSVHSLNVKLHKDYYPGDHTAFEKELGIPAELAYIEDSLFEEMSVKDSKTWPEKFLKAINPGADLSKVVAKFMIAEWEDKKIGLRNIKEIKNDKEVYGWCEEVVALYKRDLDGNRASEDEYYALYKKIDDAGARAWAGVWAWAWARAGARAWAGVGAWAGARAGAEARAEARAWAGAGARAGGNYQKKIMVSANQLLKILKETK